MENILIIGTGGRENALGWNLSQNGEVSKIIYASGDSEFDSVLELIDIEKINTTIIGPEEPLSRGIVDFLTSKGINNVFGPTKEMALIESDKFYSYDLMNESNIPQARSIKCSSFEEIREAINRFEQPVIKYRGLAKGKGVRVYDSREEAISDLASFADDFNPEALVAERLYGREFSVFAVADGKNVMPFEIAFQDYKRVYDGDKGPNTGGMGAYGPAPFVSKKLIHDITDKILSPVVEKTNYKGFLYAGMILTNDGAKVIEFNSRLGDPETQPATMMMESDLYDPIKKSLEGRLNESSIRFKEGASVCVVLASRGYPGEYEKGFAISGIEDAEYVEGIKIFHSGTKLEDNFYLTNGGRVLGVTSYSPQGLTQARDLSYEAVTKIKIPGGFQHRGDIALL